MDNLDQSPPNGIFYFSKFLVLLGLFLIGGALFAFIGLQLGGYAYGVSFSLQDTNLIDKLKTSEALNAYMFAQVVYQIGGFIIAALAFAQYYKKREMYIFLGLGRNTSIILFLLAIVALALSNPFIDWIYELNKTWFQTGALLDSEKRIDELQKAFLSGNSVMDLCINLSVVALLPAISEELLFRGALQGLLTDWLKNKYIAIVISAAIFSLIHMQFQGFLPRMALGVLLGYIYAWSGSIWVSMLAHFFNNAMVVVGQWLINRGSTIESLEPNTHYEIYTMLISTLCMVGIMYLYKKKAEAIISV